MTGQHAEANRRVRAMGFGFLVVLLLVVAIVWPGRTIRAADRDAVPGIVTIVLDTGADELNLLARLSLSGWSRDRVVLPGRVWRVAVPIGQENAAAAVMAGWPSIAAAAPETVVRVPVPRIATTALVRASFRSAAAYTPNDYWFSTQWAHTVARTPNIWDLTRGVSTVGIGIIDSGFDVGHPDAPINLVLGTDYVDGGTVAADPNGHGTHVAGIVAAAMNNSIGVAGVAPSVSVYIDRILDASGSGSDSDLVAAIYHQANDARIRVISLSLGGGTTGSSTENAALVYALAQGKIIVAATGNDDGPVLFPATYPGVIPVGAIDPTLVVTSYSNYGSSLRNYGVVAPGGGTSSDSTRIISTYTRSKTSTTPVEGYGYKSITGTSMATPYVSGVVGLMLSINPNLTREQVISILRGSARTGTTSNLPDQFYGAGIVDAEAAVGTVVALLSATATGSPTSSSTSTGTSTATSTRTATPTPTLDVFQVNVETTTPSVTVTVSVTSTVTPTQTNSPTSTSIATASATTTPSAVVSVTSTRTSTPAPSSSSVSSPSASATPSVSSTTTSTPTRTFIQTSTASPTATATPATVNSRRILFPLAPSTIRLP